MMLRSLTLFLAAYTAAAYTPGTAKPTTQPRAAVTMAKPVQAPPANAVDESRDSIWFTVETEPEPDPTISCYQPLEGGEWVCAFDQDLRFGSPDDGY